ncbi:MAG: DUF815 domain-containing protein [Oscillospiraceae bacterium]|nr:DUF815 domain-containing protein [Oscillospiraceae bacterium]
MVKNKKLQEIDLSLNSLVVFRKLMTHEVILPLRGLLDTETMDPVIQLRLYTEFVSRLYTQSMNLTEYIFRLICEDENFYIKAKARGEEVDPLLDACVENELAILERLARLKPHELQKEVSYYGVLPEWKTAEINFFESYMERVRNIEKYGYGLFARHAMFVLREGACVPVQHPDPVSLSELCGYDAERQRILDNTLSLLNGRPAQNILLYGDTGTGKSATVKAIVNTYFGEGLRLIQVTREQIPEIPQLMQTLSGNPLKFIIFLDDLCPDSFGSGISELKAALEGSVSQKCSNTVIYATSNYRGLLREHAGEVFGSEKQQHDAEQERAGLAGRFGIRVHFEMPAKQQYLATAGFLAEQRGLSIAQPVLEQAAWDYAQQIGECSPRAAGQIVSRLLAEELAK